MLCASHRESLHGAVNITPEQVFVTSRDEPAYYLVDCFGRPHGIGATAFIGRRPSAGGLAVLHHSVSLEHAKLEQVVGVGARVDDLASLNGTFVNGHRVSIPTTLFDGDVVQFGSVAFYYAREVNVGDSQLIASDGGTIPVNTVSHPFVARLVIDEMPAELVESPPGGVLRSDATTVALSKMEFSLLRVLAEGRANDYLPSQKIAAALDFQSIEAGSDNVRELVKRIRRKVRENGIGPLIASRPRHGYRLTSVVEL